MAVAEFKFLKDVEYKGREYARGSSLISEDGEMQPMVELGQVERMRYLNPESELDKTHIDSLNAANELKEISGERVQEQVTPDSPKLKEARDAQDARENGEDQNVQSGEAEVAGNDESNAVQDDKNTQTHVENTDQHTVETALGDMPAPQHDTDAPNTSN